MTNKLTRWERRWIVFAAIGALFWLLSVPAWAMHIMEGFLPAGQAALWTAVSLPFLALGIVRIKKIASEKRRALLLLAMGSWMMSMMDEFVQYLFQMIAAL